jgi:hypothetical protein
MIKQYVRKGAIDIRTGKINKALGEKLGLLVAEKYAIGDGKFRIGIGWSKARIKDQIISTKTEDVLIPGDVFDEVRAEQIALGRSAIATSAPVCQSFKKDYKSFEDRAKRYFKDIV